jgi:hypothetical protein
MSVAIAERKNSKFPNGPLRVSLRIQLFDAHAGCESNVSNCLSSHPKPANDKTRDIDSSPKKNRSLLPLPLEPFRYYGERVVHLDGCVEIEAAYYRLPPGWIGRLVKVQWDALHVRILHPGTNSTSSRAPPPETRLMQSPFRMFLRTALQKSLKHKTKMRSGAARGGHSRAGK